MDMFERLARRYCAFLGEDPDERIEGLPVWRIALCDMEAALNALDTFGVDARSQLGVGQTSQNLHPLPQRRKPATVKGANCL